MEETCSFRSGHPTSLEDEIALLALQLEEIEVFSEGGKGKYPANRPPDSNVAYEAFRTELEEYQAFLADQQMARSIAAAVFSDGVTIAELAAEEIQSHEDRVLALQMDNEESGPPLYSESIFQEPTGRVLEWVSAATESQYAGTVVDFSDDEKQGGPSTSYAERQGDVMEKLRKQSKCAAYLDFFYSGQTILLPCNDRYCINCLKGLFLRAMKDEELFPVRCHKQYIPLELISKHLSSEELAAFELASIEFTTVNRVYCFNRDCGQFIRPSQIAPGSHRALCEKCGRLTCALCKNDYHLGIDCPDDPALQETRELAGEMGWQPCHRCGSIVMLRSGCNHMTCRCKAEFCYECGVEWKNCNCDHANPRRILERAEEIVDRDAVNVLQPIERQRRIREVRNELEQNHECDHPGRFRRQFHGGRRGFRCELCDARHRKYILQCRHCFINVCEDCRRNRV